MARKRSNSLDFLVFLIIRIVICVIHAVPPAMSFWLSDRIAWLLYRFVPSRKRIALENLIASFPELGLPAAMFSKRPALVVTGHFGNWELAGTLFGRLGFKTYAIARVLDNP